MTHLTSADHARIFATRGYQDLKRLGLARYVTDEQMVRIADANFHPGVSDQVRDEVVAAHGEGVPPEVETLRPLYEYLLSRDADDPGLHFWAGVLAQKAPEIGRAEALAFVIAEFTASDAFKAETGL